MRTKVLLKTIFAMLTLLVLVMIGLNNRENVRFALPPVIPTIRQPAAVMYTAFFAFGFIASTIISSGGGKKATGTAAKPVKK